MSLLPGARLGPYEILAPIGAGGMGEVFRARDSRLNREVALKVLAEAFVDDEARRARFTREAKAAGALNHPGIVAVYDVGLADGAFYIVTELVDGETLRTTVSQGKLPQRKAVDIGVQIAESLAAAHAAGITHRDLKPENIMVTHEGRTKILDFGLAKHAAMVATADATQTQALTDDGMVLGTMGYMAPEQLRGKAVDGRSDIFSFGVVLYEMLTGLRAFQRETRADMVSAILKEDPADLPISLPPGLVQIVRRCLEKGPAQRFQSAADLAFALRSLSSGATAATPVHDIEERGSKRNWLPYAVAAAGVLLGLAGWLYRPSIEAPVYEYTPLTSFIGQEYAPALSVDGKQLAFCWRGEPPGSVGVYVKLINGNTQPLRISPPGKASSYPSWSPEGNRVAYVRAENDETSIFVAPSLGGPERRVGSYPGAADNSIAWSPDGKWIAASVNEPNIRGTQSLQLLSVATGELKRLTSAPALARDLNPRYSPDGRALAFVRVTSPFSNALYWLELKQDGSPGLPRRIGDRNWYTHTLDWFPDGKAVVIPVIADARCQYWKVEVPGGRATRVPLSFPQNNINTIGIALRGEHLATVVETTIRTTGRLVWNAGNRRWEAAEFYGSSHGDDSARQSPNGQWVVFASTRSGRQELWRANPDGSGALQITSSGEMRVGSPRWSPDSRWVVFDAGHEGRFDIFAVSAEGGPIRQINQSGANAIRPSFSSDGKWVYYFQRNLWKAPFAGGQPQSVTQTGGQEAWESADGQWVYYTTVLNSISEILRLPVVPTAPAAEGQSVLREPTALAWALAGNHIYLGSRGAEPGRIVRVHLESGKREEIYRFPSHLLPFIQNNSSLSVSSDERTIYYDSFQKPERDIVMVDHFR